MTAPTQIIIGGNDVTWHPEIDTGAGEVQYNSAQLETHWLVTSCYDPEDLVQTADDNLPPDITVDSIKYLLKGFKYSPTQPTNGGLWKVVASYIFAPEYYELQFDTSGATTKLMTALDEGTYYNCITPGDPVPSFSRLVGVTESGVEGVDVPIPKFDFTVLIRNQFETLPANYIDTIGELSGHCNDRPLELNWKGQIFSFDTEELLFQGMFGKMTSDAGFELTLKFSKSKSRSITVPMITESFTQPSSGSTVLVKMNAAAVALLTVGEFVWLAIGGKYTVTSIVDLDVVLENEGDPDNAALGELVPVGAGVESRDGEPLPSLNQVLAIGDSGPIDKPGWRYLWTNTQRRQTTGGRFVLQPVVAVVNKVIRTADLSPIGIFS